MTPELRTIAWRVLVGTGGGALAGGVVGGLGCRLLMLVLRLSSPQSLNGIESDDGFVIGRIGPATLTLLFLTAAIGAACGLLYVAVRPALPRRARSLLVGVVAGLAFGADIVRPDGIDFRLVEPRPLAIVGFVVLPGLAAAAMVLLVERLLRREPWSSRPLTALLAVAALALNLLLAAAAVLIALVWAVERRPALARAVRRTGCVVVPAVLVLLAATSALELWRDTRSILD